MKLNEVIDWILRITGIVALLKIPLKILFNKIVWMDNIKIKRVYEPEEYEGLYKTVYYYGEDKNETTIIESNVFPIRKISVYDCKFSKNKIKKDKLLYEHRNLLSGKAIFLNKFYSCSMSNCIIEIVNYDYGKATIKLSENSFNGNVNFENGIKYKYSFLTKICNLILN